MGRWKKAWRPIRLKLIDMQPAALKKRGAMVRRDRSQCAQLFFLYQGMEHKLFLDPLTFMKKTGILDRNIVMFRDHYQAFYLRGLSAEIPGFAGLLAAQRGLLAERPELSEVYCLGTSSGAYAALLFGYYLAVDTVWAFMPPTVLDLAQLKERGSLPEQAQVAAEHVDLSRLLAQGNGKTEYRIYFNEDHEPDRRAAENIAGCPGVVLQPQPGRTHNIIQTLVDDEKLAALLPPMRAVS